MADGRHLENRYVVIPSKNGPIWTKFDTLVQNDMPMTMKASKSKPEIEFQYDGCLFSETGSQPWIDITR